MLIESRYSFYTLGKFVLIINSVYIYLYLSTWTRKRFMQIMETQVARWFFLIKLDFDTEKLNWVLISLASFGMQAIDVTTVEWLYNEMNY